MGASVCVGVVPVTVDFPTRETAAILVFVEVLEVAVRPVQHSVHELSLGDLSERTLVLAWTVDTAVLKVAVEAGAVWI